MGCKSEEERWVWLSFDPKHKIILATHIGDMVQKSSDEVIKQTSNGTGKNNLPLFVTDGREFYKNSLIKKYSESIQPHPIIKNGMLQKLILKLFKELKYAQVIKTKKSGKLKSVKKKNHFRKNRRNRQFKHFNNTN
ncbi:hypothetical protein MBCUT_05200 [Methanobrevibacter cuticularis]|uniref:IS1 transposase n=1 Tax=Methanobrevibacter cuticularis TaxID=47311 RepID=A0A166EM19_9EURY|nr:hypothetical protein [Methanobrevibacter cuticularis]KZX16801.1 hypothetical protein MBCUT_05200 [Methanobrevibacter cuticularis]